MDKRKYYVIDNTNKRDKIEKAIDELEGYVREFNEFQTIEASRDYCAKTVHPHIFTSVYSPVLIHTAE